MTTCVSCHRSGVLVQSSMAVIYEPRDFAGHTVWFARQGMAMWCRACHFVREVPLDLQARVREFIPEWVPRA